VSTYTYDEVLDEVLNQVQRLTLDEQLQLLSDIAAMLRRQVESRPKHNIMEFEGIAEELWKGVDVEKYIDEERNSWDH
jgi:hypothetical protein